MSGATLTPDGRRSLPLLQSNGAVLKHSNPSSDSRNQLETLD